MNWYTTEAEVAHRQAGLLRDAERIRSGRSARLRKARRQLARVIRFDGRSGGAGGTGGRVGGDDAEAPATVRQLAA